MGEQELAKTGVAGTILRFSFVLAEDGGILNDFQRAANFGPFLIIPGDGQTQMQPILREDAARCVVEAISKPKLKLPAGLLVPGAAVMETLFKDPVVTPDEINMIQVNNLAEGIDSVS